MLMSLETVTADIVCRRHAGGDSIGCFDTRSPNLLLLIGLPLASLLSLSGHPDVPDQAKGGQATDAVVARVNLVPAKQQSVRQQQKQTGFVSVV